MFAIGDYTFAPWKVVWTRVGNKIQATVIEQSIIPQETITLVACDSLAEADFIAALVNSIPFQFAAHSYSQAGGKSFGSPHVLENIRVVYFDPTNPTHLHLAALSRHAHDLAPPAYAGEAEAKAALAGVEDEVDRAAAALWGLTDAELADVRASLRELKGVG